jgi:sugar/nucleoside kinase (ribokinase family)
MSRHPDTHSSTRRGLIAAGNWLIDHIKQIDAWPSQDTLATITSESVANGGGPYNLLKDLAKLKCGFPLAGIGLTGRDADGEYIRRDCRNHAIDHTGLQFTDDAPTAYTDVMTVAGSGRRTFFCQHGANALFGPRHCDLSSTEAGILYLGYMGLLPQMDTVDAGGSTAASSVFHRAQQLGILTVADLVSNPVADFQAIVTPSLPYLDYLFANEFELARLAGGEVTKDPLLLEAQVRSVFDRGMKGVVVIHWPEGSVCGRRSEPLYFQPAVRVPQAMVAGSAGAGDAFAAGFLLGAHERWELPRCLELAVCVAAASLRDVTCSGAVEPCEECLAFGRRLGYRKGPEEPGPFSGCDY